jgi:hypothetical protein
MTRWKIFLVTAVLLFSAAVATARLWYRQDIQWGTGSSTTPDGLPLNAVNASVIPLTTGSNVEAEIVSLRAQVAALRAAVATKAPLDSPTFTGSVILPATTTIGAVSAAEIAYLDGATSGLQAQLNAKAANENAVITGSLTVTGEITAQQFNGSSTGDHYAHLGNDGDITIPSTDNAGLIWYNRTLAKWRVTNDNAGTVADLTVTP